MSDSADTKDTATKKVTDATFGDEVLLAGKPVLVDFWATWCGPCKLVAPVLEDIARDRADQLIVAKVDVDETPRSCANIA